MDTQEMAIEGRPYPGQPCPQPGCDGVLRVETTRVLGNSRRHYLKCNKCRVAPKNHVHILPLRNAPPQAPRRRKNIR